ncbi:MAG: N-methyl-L-tryptophan oxidase, partial [Armatimonadetes bacterium]|nr:N-methyl-L-tryptophan oxidase [Anaerolineae bacterium]
STYPLWAQLAAEAGETLLLNTGGLDFGPADDPRLQATVRTVQASGIAHELLSPREAEARFPQFKFDDDFTVMYQPDSGVLKASQCVLAHVRLAGQHGATLLEQTPVTGLKVIGDSVEVQTADATYSAARLIITAGGWSAQLLEPLGVRLPLTIQRCQEVYFQPMTQPERYTAEYPMPVFLFHTSAYGDFVAYGLPSVDGSSVKASFHGGTSVPHPDDIDYTPDTGAFIDSVRAFTRRHIPAIGESALHYTRVCLYTMTPDEHFIIDQHPEYPQVVIGSPCSGHGFKFSTLIGKILGDLAVKGSTDQDISLFNLARFA